MNALELIKRIKWIMGENKDDPSYIEACNDMLDIIKQMEKEKWENAFGGIEVSKKNTSFKVQSEYTEYTEAFDVLTCKSNEYWYLFGLELQEKGLLFSDIENMELKETGKEGIFKIHYTIRKETK